MKRLVNLRKKLAVYNLRVGGSVTLMPKGTPGDTSKPISEDLFTDEIRAAQSERHISVVGEEPSCPA